MNGDSVPELFICNRTSEAGATCCVYTIVDHQLAFCGDLDYSHTSFMIGDGEGILSTWGHMGKSSQGVIKMPDDLSGDWIRETVDASEAEKQYPYMLWTYRTEDLYPLWSSSLE